MTPPCNDNAYVGVITLTIMLICGVFIIGFIVAIVILNGI